MHAMAAEPTSCDRPWYCSDHLVDDWKTIHQTGGDLKMLKSLKIVRSIVVNAGLTAITILGIKHGGDPTVIAPLALAILGAYNGVEIADYQALAQAIVEVSQETADREE
jgi:hypothetical protein